MARLQAVPMLELRIAMSEARLSEREGAFKAAALTVHSAMAAISQADDCVDLVEARALASRLKRRYPRS